MPRRRALVPAVLALGLGLTCTPPARAAAPIRIYGLGSDVTDGCDSAGKVSGWGATQTGGYFPWLDKLLDRDGVAHEFVGSRPNGALGYASDGHPGYTVASLHAALIGSDPIQGGPHSGYWLNGQLGYGLHIEPDVTLLYAGEVDLLWRSDPGTTYPTADGRADLADPAQRATFVAHLTDRVRGLVDALLTERPAVRVVVATVAADPDIADLAGPDYATALAGLVATEAAAGRRVLLADARSRLAALPGLFRGQCPTPAGYAVLGDLFRERLLAAAALP